MQSSGKRRQQASSSPTSSRSGGPPASQSRAKPRFVQHKLTGELPIFNDWIPSVADDKEEAVYFYGGSRPDTRGQPPDERLVSTEYQDDGLGKPNGAMVGYVPPDLPMANFYGGRSTQEKKLPALTDAASAVLHVAGKSFLMLFGGSNEDIVASDRLICVDMTNLAWYGARNGEKIPPEETPVSEEKLGTSLTVPRTPGFFCPQVSLFPLPTTYDSRQLVTPDNLSLLTTQY
ncbi:hypothetical protein MIND_00580800 [Mycena indigotica]|uniref:Kelch repeat-containing protein n=1 Tax=Mycena indigotica TaxID=2126181 RepID=A0A8H6SRE2_9AGAR|nr:uncharacterized protein MIND_00580800 [Mycena indigotica]KAF7303517.1 hypothetical protein MIND_00580800 [Mycena indigotica]